MCFTNVYSCSICIHRSSCQCRMLSRFSVRIRNQCPRCGSRLLPRVSAFETESHRRSEVGLCEQSEPIAAGVQGPLKVCGSFWIFNAQWAPGPPGSATDVPSKHYQWKIMHLAQTFVSIEPLRIGYKNSSYVS